MKTSWIVIVSAALGIALGVATSWAQLALHVEPDPILSDHLAGQGAPVAADGSHPTAVVNVDEFDFGSVAANQSVDHSFIFKNEGDAPLKLVAGGTTCAKCTVSSVPASRIAPGESAEVVIEYHAADQPAKFRQSATILTNDPQRTRIELTVSGEVVVPVGVTPNDVVFSRLSAAETRTVATKVVAYLDAEFAIESFDLVDTETAKFFEVKIEPLASEELESLGGKRGYNVSITIKPGMPLGPVRQKLVLHTNLPQTKELRIPIQGSIESDISIAGPQFNRDLALLTIGMVEHEGAERKLLVRIHGDQRHEIKVSVASTAAPLEATLGEPSDTDAGSYVQIPLTIKIPPGSPSANYLVKYGKVMLETNHPEAKQIRIWVQFAVQQ